MAQLKLAVTGMTCQNCVQHVHDALAPLARSVIVTLDPPQVIMNQPQASFVQMQSALSGTRYNLQAQTGEPGSDLAPVSLRTYWPLFLLILYILLAVMGIQWQQTGSIEIHESMRLFMAGFFLAFSFFKLLNINAFADAYSGYDLLAARWYGWGYVYPYLELGLGVAYLFNIEPLATNWVTLVLMSFSTLGVIAAVLNRKRIRCACLGAVFNLPMSTVSILEDLSMAAMAAWTLNEMGALMIF